MIGHCDLAPWNIICCDGLPVGLIDWDFAGPTDYRVNLAQACWQCAMLHDDVVADLDGLPPAEERAVLLRAILDGYGLADQHRMGFVDLILDFIIYFNAWQADDFGITADNRPTDPTVSWAFAWVSRSAAWIHQHRAMLQDAITQARRAPTPWRGHSWLPAVPKSACTLTWAYMGHLSPGLTSYDGGALRDAARPTRFTG